VKVGEAREAESEGGGWMGGKVPRIIGLFCSVVCYLMLNFNVLLTDTAVPLGATTDV